MRGDRHSAGRKHDGGWIGGASPRVLVNGGEKEKEKEHEHEHEHEHEEEQEYKREKG